MPSKRYNGILFNAKQYNYVLETMNTVDAGGKLPGEKGYDAGTTLLSTLSGLVNDPYYAGIESKEKQLEEVKNVVSTYKQGAIKMLMRDDKAFKLKVMAVQLDK
jgi:hypothetical protein